MLPKAQGCVCPALGRYGVEEGRSRGFRKTGDMCRLTEVAPGRRHVLVHRTAALQRRRNHGANLGILMHGRFSRNGLLQTTKARVPGTPESELCLRDLDATPLPGAWHSGSNAQRRAAHAEDVKSSSCSMVTLHNNPFREPTGSAAGSRIGSTSAVLPRRGPGERRHMVPGSNGVQRALMKRHSQRRVLRADEGSARRKHLSQGISTPVANRSARAQIARLEAEDGLSGSHGRCVSDARCE